MHLHEQKGWKAYLSERDRCPRCHLSLTYHSEEVPSRHHSGNAPGRCKPEERYSTYFQLPPGGPIR